ncbi:MAG: glycosyltransferase family 2 protein [Bacteroidetes bacterium]|nr:glycosyltransferase family 2 protein [Bacteroidota bacterium]
MKTAIVILNWNGRKLLEEFLPNILLHSTEQATVIVADNASTDDSISYIKKHYPQVKIIENATNEGFAEGYNAALKQVEAEYFLLLNSDVEVTAGWLNPLVNYMEAHPNTAVCQPKMRWYHHREKFEYAGACGGFIDSWGYPFCRGRIFNTLEKDTGQYDAPSFVFWASGACMLIRASVFHASKGFDSIFFAHMEEVDLCWRIRNMGYDIVCLPSSTVYHMGGATLPKNNSRKTYLNFRNNLSMLYKNLPASKLFPVILLRLILDGVAGIKFLIEGGPGDCFAVFRAHWKFYGWVLSGKLKRPIQIKHIKHATIYDGSIVWNYYIQNKRTFTDLVFHPGKPQ